MYKERMYISLILKIETMKILLSILLLSALLSCKKEGAQTCWKCQYGIVNGETRADETICNDGQEPEQKFNSIGSPFNQSCQKL